MICLWQEFLSLGFLGSIKLLVLRKITCMCSVHFSEKGCTVFFKILKGSHNPNRFRITGPDLRVEIEPSSRGSLRGCILQLG